MYRMIIVDDNPWDCKGIQSIIDWNALGIEIVGSYSNGQKALDKIDDVKPHIVLTDVAMPVMDGIDLAKTLKERYPEIKVIFLSSYDDFNFARSAINLDVFGYVLKPVVPHELIKTISKVINRNMIENLQKEEKGRMMRQINASLPLVQEEFLRELLFGLYGSMDGIRERTEFLSLQIHLNEDASIWVLSMDINNYEEITEEMDMTGKYLISYTIKEIILSLNNSNRVIYPVGISSKEIACIIFNTDQKFNTKKTDTMSKSDQIIDIAVSLHNKINEKLKLDVKIGISLSSHNPVDIHKLYTQAGKALQTKFYGTSNPIVLYHEIENKLDGLSEENVAIEELYRDVKNVLLEENMDVTQLLDKYLGDGSIKYSEKYIRGLVFSIINIMQIALMDTELSFRDILGSEMLVWEKLYRFETILDIRQWLANLFKALKEHINKNTSRNARIVEDIKNIIKQRYNEQLTINSIAEAIYLSPSHANRIFKNEMGISIFDYLTQYRIDMAKNMLKDPYVKIYQIAEKIGYTSTAHFCLIFKKYTGISPASYRQHAGV